MLLLRDYSSPNFLKTWCKTSFHLEQGEYLVQTFGNLYNDKSVLSVSKHLRISISIMHAAFWIWQIWLQISDQQAKQLLCNNFHWNPLIHFQVIKVKVLSAPIFRKTHDDLAQSDRNPFTRSRTKIWSRWLTDSNELIKYQFRPETCRVHNGLWSG